MIKYETSYKGKTLQLSVYAENIVRIRISDDFKPTLLERYKIYRKPDEVGELLENGVCTKQLSVTYQDGKILFSSHKFSRSIDLDNARIAEVKEYMNQRLNYFHDERVVILGSEDEEQLEEKIAEFQFDPKYITLKVEEDLFYGLGEANNDRLLLNGKTYRQRVVYVKNEIPVPYLMTPQGYGILANTSFWHGIDVCESKKDEIVWYLPQGDIDFMIFAADDMRGLLERFTYLVGRPTLLPKWAYGLTFIEHCQAREFDLLNDARLFRQYGIPCSAMSLEPGWTTVRYDYNIPKKWNKERFYLNDAHRNGTARPFFFTSALKRYGFRLHAWLCCHFDFSANEERLLGEECAPEIPAFFDHLREFCNDGLDSFKIDPNRMVDTSDEHKLYANGRTEAEMHSLNQTLIVKEMYMGAKKHRGNVRPMHHYCGGYTGSGAYTATTTGDAGGGLNTLAWTLNTGLSGFSNVTCDMNTFDAEGIHYAFFTGWCQLNSWAGHRHPWWVGEKNFDIFKFYDLMRYALMPYVYTHSVEASLTGTPICRALPLIFEDEAAQNVIHEYMFGDYLLVGAFSDKIYLPKGYTWYDAWSDKIYEGGQEIKPEIPENRGGMLFIRSGAIIPTEAPKQFEDDINTPHLILNLYPSGKSSYTLYEDDGVTFDYEKGERAATQFMMEEDEKGCKIHIGERVGSFKGMAENRTYSVKVRLEAKPLKIKVDGIKVKFTYDKQFASFEIGEGKDVEIIYREKSQINSFLLKFEKFFANSHTSK